LREEEVWLKQHTPPFHTDLIVELLP
jgi:hypothetical protein